MESREEMVTKEERIWQIERERGMGDGDRGEGTGEIPAILLLVDAADDDDDADDVAVHDALSRTLTHKRIRAYERERETQAHRIPPPLLLPPLLLARARARERQMVRRQRDATDETGVAGVAGGTDSRTELIARDRKSVV